MNQQNKLFIIRLPECMVRTGLSRSSIYQRIAEGTFPKPFSLGGKKARAVGWLSSSIDNFINDLIEASNKAEMDV